MIAIYALVDPGTTELRYIGLTRSPERRLGNYRNGRGHTGRLREWLKTIGEPPVLEVLEWVVSTAADVREQYWIALLRTCGARLLNYTSGGEGTFQVAAETKALIAQRQRAYYTGRPLPCHTSEARAKMAATMRGSKKPWAGRTLTQLNKSRAGIPLSPAHRAAMSRALCSKPMSLQHRQAMAKAGFRNWQDPAYRALIITRLQNSPHVQASILKAAIVSANQRRGKALTDQHRLQISTTMQGRPRNAGLQAYWAARKHDQPGGRSTITESKK